MGQPAHTEGRQSPFSVAVFCGARCAPDHRFVAVASAVGREIALRGWRIVYGGGDHGLMGALATAALDAGGDLLAVLPTHIVISERVTLPTGVTVVRTTSTRERKQIMDDESDAFLVLPGGIGTLEELAEVLTLRQLGMHTRPVVILNIGGFWGPLMAQFSLMERESLVGPPISGYIDICESVDSALKAASAAGAAAHAVGECRCR